jgi:hypothetical protein
MRSALKDAALHEVEKHMVGLDSANLRSLSSRDLLDNFKFAYAVYIPGAKKQVCTTHRHDVIL